MTKIELRRVNFKEAENFHGLGSTASLPLDNNNGNVRLAYYPELRAVEVAWQSLGGDAVDPRFSGPVMIPEHRVTRWYQVAQAVALPAPMPPPEEPQDAAPVVEKPAKKGKAA